MIPSLMSKEDTEAFVRASRSTWSRLRREASIRDTRNLLLGVVLATAAIILMYVGMSMLDALIKVENQQAAQLHIRSVQLHYLIANNH
jgi:hypothetical protein